MTHSERTKSSVKWGILTKEGHSVFISLRSKKAAQRYAEEWSKTFPENAPFLITRNGEII